MAQLVRYPVPSAGQVARPRSRIYLPAVTAGVDATVGAVPAVATGTAPAPTVQAGSAVSAAPAVATGTAPAPSVPVGLQLVNTTTGSSGVGATSIPATAASHTTGNLIVVGVVWSNNVTVSSVTDTAGNTYVSTGFKADNGTTDHVEIWYAKNITGNAANVVTANFSASATFRRIMVLQYSGADTAAPFTTGEGGTTVVAVATSTTTSSWTTAAAKEVIVGVQGQSAAKTVTASTGFTKEISGLGGDSNTEDQIVSTTGTYTAGFTWTGTMDAWLAAASFKAAGGGGTDATVSAAPAVAAGTAPAPVVSGSGNATVSAVPAVASGTAPPANGILSSVVDAPAAVATGTAPAPAVSGSGSATVSAAPAVAAGQAAAPVLHAGSTVTTIPATAAGTAPAPAVSGTGSATVSAVPATAAGTAPVVVPHASSTTTGVPAAATGKAPAPTFTGHYLASPPVAAATGTAPTPVPHANVLITALAARAAGIAVPASAQAIVFIPDPNPQHLEYTDATGLVYQEAGLVIQE